jgi:hypothetical protein
VWFSEKTRGLQCKPQTWRAIGAAFIISLPLLEDQAA